MPSTVTNAYALKTSSIPKLLDEIKKAAIPSRFSQDFLAGLGFTSSNDRMLISIFKGLGFIDGNGIPTSIYREFRDPTKAKRILARQIRSAYAGLFELNTQAQMLNSEELRGKISSITGQSESVINAMAATFATLSREADFSDPEPAAPVAESATESIAKSDEVISPAMPINRRGPSSIAFSHTLYINLPATRDVAVYDAIFKALKEHLM